MRRPTTSRRSRKRQRTWLGTDAQVVRHVRVCGEGHLATATRIELERQGIHRDSDYLLPSLRPPLVIACADSEADLCFNDAAQRALDEGSPLLLCCLVGPVVRLGPLIDPYACFPSGASRQPAPAAVSSAKTPTPASPVTPSAPLRAQAPTPLASHPPASTDRSQASSPEERPHPAQRPWNPPTNPDPPLTPDARLAALLVSAQALNFLLGARNQCVLDRVVELNPGSMESMAYQVFHN